MVKGNRITDNTESGHESSAYHGIERMLSECTYELTYEPLTYASLEKTLFDLMEINEKHDI